MKLSTFLLSAVLLVASAAAFSFSVNRRSFVGEAAISLIVAAPWVALADDVETDADGFITTESGMKYKVLKEGVGAIPEPGQTVKAHYTGWLDGFDSIKKFDSSRDRGRPFSFRVGAGQVIRGWDESFSTMKVGERRQIILPPRLAYGKYMVGVFPPSARYMQAQLGKLDLIESLHHTIAGDRGAGGIIPGGATLYFVSL